MTLGDTLSGIRERVGKGWYWVTLGWHQRQGEEGVVLVTLGYHQGQQEEGWVMTEGDTRTKVGSK